MAGEETHASQVCLSDPQQNGRDTHSFNLLGNLVKLALVDGVLERPTFAVFFLELLELFFFLLELLQTFFNVFQ